MMTFQNGDGGKEDGGGGHKNEGFLCKGVYTEIKLNNSTKCNHKGDTDDDDDDDGVEVRKEYKKVDSASLNEELLDGMLVN